MKTFIFLSILIIGIFVYIFGYQNRAVQAHHAAQTTTADATPTLEHIEREAQAVTSAAPSPVTEKTAASHELSSLTQRQKLAPIQEDDTFDRLKNILQTVRPNYRYANITLNTPMSLFLRSEQERNAFSEAIASEFHLDYNQVEKGIQKNRILWDWVNQLR